MSKVYILRRTISEAPPRYEYGRLNGPFEYVTWHASEPTPLLPSKACGWAAALGCDAIEVRQ